MLFSYRAICQQQVSEYSGAVHKKFTSRFEAERFIQETSTQGPLPDIPQSVTIETTKCVYCGKLIYSDSDLIAPKLVPPVKPKPALPVKPKSVPPVKPASYERVYTDGAAINNGRPGAIAGIGVYFGPNDPRNISEPLWDGNQTNQRAELAAILCALEMFSPHTPLEICTDSQYSIDCIRKWNHGWKKNNWKTATGGDVVNVDIIQGILEKIQVRAGPVKLTKVRGHSGDPGNDGADQLAVLGANKRTE
ncbi:ribonuclease H-like domain-containing protein [Dimargaris cristalligena]|uniref:ribonuclease H n=1 Tax=Dimargaris cristalligena TaxID=215637 RepID=A0A4P9ZN01_9FUNG|nr:ribonuclease H-like domain-containing protein [Dimargaris cristalligena]|eukprot:RKP34774.1 ribonuclease H-like domain-containing protein [Dimargaris cristalligena]